MCSTTHVCLFVFFIINRWSSSADLIFVTIPNIQDSGEKFAMWKNFSFPYMTNIEIYKKFSTCGVISDFSAQQMWRNSKFLHFWHVCDEKNASQMQNLCYFVIRSLLLQNLSCRDLHIFVWRKIHPKTALVEKQDQK